MKGRKEGSMKLSVLRAIRMDCHYHVSILLLLLLLLNTLPPPSLSQQPSSNHSDCVDKTFECGTLSRIGYPFWGGGRPSCCGGGDQFNLTCENETSTLIQMGSPKFLVTNIQPETQTLTLVPPSEGPDLSIICYISYNFTMSPGFNFVDNQTLHNVTLFYGCPPDVTANTGNNFTCFGGSRVVYYEDAENQDPDLVLACQNARRIRVPVEAVVAVPHPGILGAYLDDFVGIGFRVKYTTGVSSHGCAACLKSGGACGSNDSHQFTCYCPDGSNALPCYLQISKHHLNWRVKYGVISAAAALALLSACCCACKLSRLQENNWLISRSNHDIEAFLKNHGALILRRYKFSDVKKMTNSFKVKLGQGGFGVVYKGNLPDGSDVAVKMLNPSKGNGEDFINEVASISRTSHVNVVALLGFCIEGRKKALIYEFMLHGSLDKFINKTGHSNPPLMLTLNLNYLYQIAIGVARGLEYLHRGCNTRILHFDIKPHNILLDENFRPKISDFGLAKLCPRKESLISMSDARGTIGYVAPEVWNRHFGRVSHKSDVYSYGMMLLEMVGGKKNINTKSIESSEIYFPDWIYKRLEEGTHLGLDGEELAVEENEVIKRMTMVGLWCIQPIPNDRPTMSRVVEMLEGSINSLEMPPKPVLSSPIRSVVESSTTQSTLS